MIFKYPDWVLLRRIAREARVYWPHLFGILVLNLLAAPVALLTPVPLKIVIDCIAGSQPLPAFISFFVPSNAQHSSIFLALLAPALLLGVVLLTYLQGSGTWLLQTYTGERLLRDFRAKLFGHVQHASLSYHDLNGAADSAFRIQNDAPAIQNVVLGGFITLVAALARLACMVWVTARLDRQLALIALGTAPFLFILTRVFRGKLRLGWKRVRESESAANKVVSEALSAIRVVKAFGREKDEHARYLHQSNLRLRDLLKACWLQVSFDLLLGVTIGLGTAATLYVGVIHVRAGALTLGNLTLVTAYVLQLLDPLKALSKNVADLQSGLASAERAFTLLDRAPDVVETPRPVRLKDARGDIRFEHVSFAYSPDREILTDVNFHLRPGGCAGIQGPSGAGKTTLINLLTRFYDVTGGRVLLDGVDIRKYKIADLRRQFGVVLQDSVLFSTSIAQNIAYGKPGATHEEIVAAAKLANAHDFIAELPSGYATLAGQRGMQLSGGERQRIALARAFLKDAPILILDEPTSAMDAESESLVMEALERLMWGRTTLIIAHRLNTLERCEVRLEVRDGRVLESDREWLAVS